MKAARPLLRIAAWATLALAGYFLWAAYDVRGDPPFSQGLLMQYAIPSALVSLILFGASRR